MVTFRRARVFARFHYREEEGPPFHVLAGLGDVREGIGFFGPRRPMLHGLGLWEVIDDEADREVLREGFTSDAELRRLLAQVRDRTLPWAERMLDDAPTLRRKIRRRA